MKHCMCGASVVPGKTGIETEDGGILCDWCLEEQAQDHIDATRYDAADVAMDMRERS